MKTTKMLRLASCLLVTTVLAACGIGGKVELIDSESKKQKLAAKPGYSGVWPDHNIKLCFTDLNVNNDKKLSDKEFNMAKEAITEGLRESWAASSAVSFSIGCTGNTLPIKLNWTKDDGQPQYGGACGYGPSTTCVVETKFPENYDHPDNYDDLNLYLLRLKGIAIHEVGHALGIPHEHQRADSTGETWEEPLCTNKQAAYDKAIIDISIYANDESDEAKKIIENAKNIIKNHEQIPSLEKLTPHDPFSIMNYCRNDNLVALGMYPDKDRAVAFPPLSYLDRLGIEMLYPVSFQPEIRGDLCFGKICREERLRFVTEWFARGALPSSFFTPRWQVRYTYNSTGQEASYVRLVSGVTSFPYGLTTRLVGAIAHSIGLLQTIHSMRQ